MGPPSPSTVPQSAIRLSFPPTVYCPDGGRWPCCHRLPRLSVRLLTIAVYCTDEPSVGLTTVLRLHRRRGTDCPLPSETAVGSSRCTDYLAPSTAPFDSPTTTFRLHRPHTSRVDSRPTVYRQNRSPAVLPTAPSTAQTTHQVLTGCPVYCSGRVSVCSRGRSPSIAVVGVRPISPDRWAHAV